MAGLADPPPHGGGFSRFLDTSNYQPCNTDAACTAAGVKYLKAIGVLNAAGQPAGPRKSLDDWKAFVGFNAKVSVATAQALYFNKYDLGFARDANCVFREVGIKPAITTVACYITNYSDAQPGWPGGNPQKSISGGEESHIAAVHRDDGDPLHHGPWPAAGGPPAGDLPRLWAERPRRYRP